jgi:hypothetical protein
MDAGAIVLLLLMLGGKKTSGNGTSARASGQAAQSDATLLSRANSPRALAWAITFQNAGVSKGIAEAWARWAGIESGGNPLAVSPIGERGLFQITKTTAKGTVTPAEWEAMVRPSTAREEHARMALSQAAKYWQRAKTMIKNPPTDPVSKIWYAKMWHSRPADFNGHIMHGAALDMARQLQQQWKDDAEKMYRLRVANVIAFGVPIVATVGGSAHGQA